MKWVCEAYDAYTKHKQTYSELSEKYHKSPKTLRKYFDRFAGPTGELASPAHPIVLIMDATFFGRGYGILLCRSRDQMLYWKEIVTESIVEYECCLDALETIGCHFSAFVIDGRSGVRQLLEKRYPGVPIQFCQFHQMAIVKRYIPRRAKTEAARSLRKLALGLKYFSKSELDEKLSAWCTQYGAFLKERSITPGALRWRYTHGRVRSAYRSLVRNLRYLFAHQEFPHLNIPNTTNHCDGLFAHIKQWVLIHRGISKIRRKKMIDYFLEQQ